MATKTLEVEVNLPTKITVTYDPQRVSLNNAINRVVNNKDFTILSTKEIKKVNP